MRAGVCWIAQTLEMCLRGRCRVYKGWHPPSDNSMIQHTISSDRTHSEAPDMIFSSFVQGWNVKVVAIYRATRKNPVGASPVHASPACCKDYPSARAAPSNTGVDFLEMRKSVEGGTTCNDPTHTPRNNESEVANVPQHGPPINATDTTTHQSRLWR